MPHYVGLSSIVDSKEQEYQALTDKSSEAAKASRLELDARVAVNQGRINDPEFRKALFENFAPTFCFHKSEDSFPMKAENYIEQVVMAKYNHYRENAGKLTPEEKKELNLIVRYFVTPDGKFNENYAAHQEEPDFQEILPTKRLLQERDINWAKARYEELCRSDASLSPKDLKEKEVIEKEFCKKSSSGKFDIDATKFDERGYIKNVYAGEVNKVILNEFSSPFLNFDEKKHGYALGSKVSWNAKPSQAPNGAPAYVTIIPTPDGALIKYNRFYSISSAIPGTKWLYKLLPHKLSEKLKHFAVHAGDWEGVAVKVKIDDTGKATLGGMQSFAHGRDGAQYLEADKLTYDDKARPCAFVGAATHGMYLSNHVGRTKFVDKLGDHIKETPKEFVDISSDREPTLPSWCKIFQRFGSPSSPAPRHLGAETKRDYQDFIADAPHWVIIPRNSWV